MRRTHIPTALLLCLSKEQRFTEKERQRTFWFALYLSLSEFLSQTSWFRCLKNKILQRSPVIRINYWCHTLFNAHRKRTCQVRLTSSSELYSARSENAHVKEDWPQVSNSTRHAHKTLINLTCQVRMTYRRLFGALRKRTSQLRLTTSLRVRSFGRIRIRISDMWRSVWANPFSDQWSIKSTLDLTLDLTLDKDSSDH